MQDPRGLHHATTADHLTDDGSVLIQFEGAVLEAERNELAWLRDRLESLVAAAA